MLIINEQIKEMEGEGSWFSCWYEKDMVHAQK